MNNSSTIKYKAVIILAMLLCAVSVHAQREKNNIYLFDCTGSMKTNGLWQPAKEALNATIDTQSTIPGSQFTIIPFGDSPYSYFVFGSTDYKNKKSDITHCGE